MKFAKCRMYILLVVLLALSLTACSASNGKVASTEDYTVYLYGSLLRGDAVLVDGADSYAFTQNRELTVPEEESVSISINGVEHTLHYSETTVSQRNEVLYYYTSEDKNVVVSYLAHNGELSSMTLHNQDLAQLRSMTEEECDTWLRQFVGTYTTEDWAIYDKYCQTKYTTSDGYIHRQDGYPVVLPENARLSSRSIQYVKPYQSLKTEDSINIFISFDTDSLSIGFNQNRLDGFSAEVDVDQMHTAITDFVEENLATDSKLQNITIENGTLFYVDGNVLCQWTVTVSIQSASGSALEGSFDVFVDIPDA